MDSRTLEELKGRLIAERDSLDRQLGDYGASGDSFGVSIGEGFADSGQATAERTEALGIVDSLRTQRKEVVDALARMENGTYGQCDNCGQEIPDARLEAVPAARLCVSCKQGRRS